MPIKAIVSTGHQSIHLRALCFKTQIGDLGMLSMETAMAKESLHIVMKEIPCQPSKNNVFSSSRSPLRPALLRQTTVWAGFPVSY